MIVLEDHVVASRFDPLTSECVYIVEHDGKRWTVRVPLAHLENHGSDVTGKMKRRAHLVDAINRAMQVSPGGDPRPDRDSRSIDVV